MRVFESNFDVGWPIISTLLVEGLMLSELAHGPHPDWPSLALARTNDHGSYAFIRKCCSTVDDYAGGS